MRNTRVTGLINVDTKTTLVTKLESRSNSRASTVVITAAGIEDKVMAASRAGPESPRSNDNPKPTSGAKNKDRTTAKPTTTGRFGATALSAAFQEQATASV